MKNITKILIVFALCICGSAMAQTDLTGTWQGKLDIGQGQKLTIQFIITRGAGGSYTALVDSPDSDAVTKVPADTVEFANGNFSLQVSKLSGSYSGTVGNNSIKGEWKQPGGSFPLVMTPYTKPVLTAAGIAQLEGEWVGAIKVTDSTSLTLVLRMKKNSSGKLDAFLDSPDQGAKNIPVADVVLEDNVLTVKVPAVQGEYSGTLSGKTLTGTWKQMGSEVPLNLTKGKYQPKEIALNLSGESGKALLGQWLGKMTIPPDKAVTIVFRFRQTPNGKIEGFMDSPDEGAKDLSITEASFEGNQLSVKIGPREYTGTLENDLITGTYKVGTLELALDLKKGAQYEPQTQVEIPAEMMQQLSGRWTGKLGERSVIFTLQRKAGAKDAFYMEIPEQGTKLLILKAFMSSDGTLTLALVPANYTGKLSGNKIEGTFKQGTNSIPLVLTKE